jgi:hypothetical protein
MPRRNELGDRDTVARDEDFFPFEHEVQKFGQVRFGLVDVEGGHTRMLARKLG